MAIAISASLIFPSKLSGSRMKSAGKSGLSALSFKLRNGSVKCEAAGESSQSSFEQTVFEGVYGSWKLEESDVREVILYSSGLVTAASTFVIAASDAFLPSDSSLREIIGKNLDLSYTLGAGGLGLSLLLIHIYVTEIKRTLQALWALGVIGSLGTHAFLAQPAGENLIQYVIENPQTVWFVGPLFASLTGLVFKEGNAALEAGILTIIIPSVLLGHLMGLMDNGVTLALLGSWMALFVIFAGRKFTQPIKDDVGHKSVFMFNSLQEDEKKALIRKLEQEKLGQDLN